MARFTLLFAPVSFTLRKISNPVDRAILTKFGQQSFTHFEERTVFSEKIPHKRFDEQCVSLPFILLSVPFSFFQLYEYLLLESLGQIFANQNQWLTYMD